MGLQVIGAGFGRTGTLSLKIALEKLGVGPCYHMTELLLNPTRAAAWRTAAAKAQPDWDAILSGYRATTDWPACAFWRELADVYHNAVVILSVRDSEEWYSSFARTVLPLLNRREHELPNTPEARTMQDMLRRVIVDRSFAGSLQSKTNMLRAFERHNAMVRQTVSPGRLLEYRVSEGWKPLCDFIGIAVPDSPFPWLNDQIAFHKSLREGRPPPM